MFFREATTDITKKTDAKGFDKCRDSAKEGGQAANEARRSIEKRIGKSVISKKNYLPIKKEIKR